MRTVRTREEEIMFQEKVILLVEDTEAEIALTLLALKRSQITSRVVVARDGVDALAYLFGREGTAAQDPQTLPQIVLLDLKLPKIDGFDVLERIRADVRTHRLPVIVLTSSSEPRDLARAYDLGASSYIRKPIDFTQFTQDMRTTSRYWLDVNAAP